MPKTCRVKILTRRPRKRRGFCGNKGKKDTDVNSDINIDNSVDNDCGDPNNISGLSAIIIIHEYFHRIIRRQLNT